MISSPLPPAAGAAGGAIRYTSPVPPRLILASASPRRLDLLRDAGYAPLVLPADVDETPDPGASPRDNAARFARAKAERVAAAHPGDVVLGADTVVTIAGQLLGKPKGRADAERMLRLLAGTVHHVVTCVHLPALPDWPATSLCVDTAVVFRALDDDDLAAYLAGGEWEGKAGGYAIQGRAAAFAEAVVGSYTNVVGLPLCEVVEELRARGLRPSRGATP